MRLIFLVLLGAVVTLGCAHQQYWGKQDADIRQTAGDLQDCRLAANAGGQKVFSAMELEGPCMAAKGYELRNSPPLR
jgi:hypothetical protein